MTSRPASSNLIQMGTPPELLRELEDIKRLKQRLEERVDLRDLMDQQRHMMAQIEAGKALEVRVNELTVQLM